MNEPIARRAASAVLTAAHVAPARRARRHRSVASFTCAEVVLVRLARQAESPSLVLYDAIEDARRQRGAHGVVDLLVSALSGVGVRRDADIDRYLDELKSACRQTRRYREVIPVLRRIEELNPARRYEVAAELAVVHAHLGEVDRGRALLAAAVAGERRLPAARRSAAFALIGEVAATVLRQPELARAVAALRVSNSSTVELDQDTADTTAVQPVLVPVRPAPVPVASRSVGLRETVSVGR
jgi:hypothetical protein